MMAMIPLPKYKPEQWIVYKNENDDAVFGYVTSGEYMDNREYKGWIYEVKDGDSGDRVRENEIMASFDGENWNRSDNPTAKRGKRGLYL
jgi:hypothetical protein